MWDLIVSIPDRCLSFYLGSLFVKGLQADAQQRVPRGKGLQVDAQQRPYRRVPRVKK